MEIFAIIFILGILFFFLFEAISYLLLFTFLLLPRLLPPVRRIPLKLYLLADAGISIASVVLFTALTGYNPTTLTERLLPYLFPLLPPFLVALFAASMVNIAGLYRSTWRDAREFRFKPIFTTLTAAVSAILYVTLIAIF